MIQAIYTQFYCVAMLLCRMRSIAAHRDHFVRRLSVCACVCLSDSHTFLIVTHSYVTHSYVSQATHAFLGMLPLCCLVNIRFCFTYWNIYKYCTNSKETYKSCACFQHANTTKHSTWSGICILKASTWRMRLLVICTIYTERKKKRIFTLNNICFKDILFV